MPQYRIVPCGEHFHIEHKVLGLFWSKVGPISDGNARPPYRFETAEEAETIIEAWQLREAKERCG